MIKNKVAFTNQINNKELAAISLDGANIEEIKSTREFVAYENNMDETDIKVEVIKTDIVPFSSDGKERELEVNNKPLNSPVTVCGNPNDNNKTAILEYWNGESMIIEWHEITSVKHTLTV